MPALSLPQATVIATQLPAPLRINYRANVQAETTRPLRSYTPRSDAVFGVYHVSAGVSYVDSTHGGYALSSSCTAMSEWIGATRWPKAYGCLNGVFSHT